MDRMSAFWNKDWVIKIISLCIACLLWYLVGGEDLVEKNVSVPVEVINLPKNLIIANKYKKEIEVSVKGPRSMFIESDRQVPLQIDLSKAGPGTHVETIKTEDVPIKRGIEVQRVQPSSIILSLDTLIEKTFRIEAETKGKVAPGFVMKDLTLSLNSIKITGPQTVLSPVDVLKTVPINIEGLSKSMQLQIPLQLNGDFVDLIGETSVTADVDVGYDSFEKTVQDVRVISPDEEIQQHFDPQFVTVTLQVPKLILKKGLNYHHLITAIAVPVEGDETGRYKVQVAPTVSSGPAPEVVSVTPQYVTLPQERNKKKEHPDSSGKEDSKDSSKK